MNQIFKDLAVMIHDQGEMIGEDSLSLIYTSEHCSYFNGDIQPKMKIL